MERAGLGEAVGVFDCRAQKDRLAAFGFECIDKANNDNLDIFGESMLLYLIGHLTVRTQNDGGLLSSIITVSGENFTDHHFSLRTLADILGYDAKYLSFYFKKNRGIGYSEYLRELRIDHSVFLIEQGVDCVKNIALLSGFSDALYFSKVFKKSKGKSPREYIREHYSTDPIDDFTTS